MQPSRRQMLIGAASLAAAGLVGTGLDVTRAQAPDAAAPDLVIHNARITTLNPEQPDAQAVAVQGGRIVAVGSNDQVLARATPQTRRIDARNRRLIPGLSDTHTHTVRGGLNYALELRWDGVRSLADALEMLRQQARRTPPGQWVRVVGGWSYMQFAEQRQPTLDEINAVAPDTPVFVLYLYSSAMLNKAALRYLGIDRNFPDNRYPGGKIVRDASGDPTGLLLADPSALILYSTLHDGPKLDPQQQLISSRHFMKELNRLGITASLDCGGGFQQWPEDYSVIQQLHKDQQLTMRIGVSTFIQRPGKELEDFTNWTERYKAGEGDDMLFLLGAGEMLVRSVYDFEVWGMPQVIPPAGAEADLEPVIRLLAQRQWPFRFHATYNETIGRHLDVLERVHREHPIDQLHWIVDHAETLSDENLERIARLGGGIAIQNRIQFQEKDFLDRYGPEMAAEAPGIKRMLKMGVPVGAGTDMSRVSSYNPWLCLQWLVTGKGAGGLTLLTESTRLDRLTALRLWCDNAWFYRKDNQFGRVQEGRFADLALLSDDYFTIPANEIEHIESVLTVVGGKIVYAADEYSSHDPALPALTPDWSPVNHLGGYGSLDWYRALGR